MSITTHIKDYRKLFAIRILWWVFFIWGGSAILISTPINFQHELNTFESAETLIKSHTINLSPSFIASYSITFKLTSFMSLVLIGGTIFYNRSNNWMALWLSMALVLLTPVNTGYFSRATMENPGLGLFLGPVWLAGVLLGISVVFLFPDGKISPSWLRWLFIPYVTWETVRAFMYFVEGETSFILGASIVPSMIMTIIGVSAQFYSYRYSDHTTRHQIKWFAYGVPAMMTMFATTILIRDGLSPQVNMDSEQFTILAGYPLTVIGNVILAICLGIAITRYRLYDIDFVINRSLVGFLVTILLIIVFVITTLILKNLLQADNDILAFGLSAIVPALLFNPTRRWIRYYIDRRFYGLAFDLNELRSVGRKQSITHPGVFSGQLFGQYQLLDVIGRGGMGEVYKAQIDDTLRAIKVLITDDEFDSKNRLRFEREAQAGQILKHPNIAQIIDYGKVEDTPYLVMEYVEGHDLSTIIKDQGALTENSTFAIIQDVAAALDEVHRHGFVHRDLKPGNIMIRPDGHAVLMDFGVTKFSDATMALTGTEAVGTIAYMAPEQILESRDVGREADIYAMGVMCFEMLTGQQPFKGGMGQVLFAHLQQPAPNPRTINAAIREEIADVILQALEKKPEDRFSSAGEFAKTLLSA